MKKNFSMSADTFISLKKAVVYSRLKSSV